ncbi:molecular chaperone [Edwardsiella piscicida]|nr:molecular chaperone [Edwardsiella piscicida]
MLLKPFSAALLLFSAYLAAADERGIYLDKTRVVLLSDKSAAPIGVINRSTSRAWLIRGWVDAYSGTGDDTFLVTPTLFRLGPDSQIRLRVNAIRADRLPQDRESVFRLNVLSIPARDAQTPEGDTQVSGSLSTALNNQIKLFYRPLSLHRPAEIDAAYRRLRFEKNPRASGWSTPPLLRHPGRCHDQRPPPERRSGDHGRPLGELILPFIPAASAQRIRYSAINDYGGRADVLQRDL